MVFPAGHSDIKMTASLWVSATTFRRDFTEKAIFILLNQLDLILTVLAVSLGFSELNPFMRNLLTSPVQLFIFKGILPFCIAWLLPGKFLLPGIFLLCLVVGWDIKELLLSLF